MMSVGQSTSSAMQKRAIQNLLLNGSALKKSVMLYGSVGIVSCAAGAVSAFGKWGVLAPLLPLVLVLSARFAAHSAVVCLLFGPGLLSVFPVGQLTADNIVSTLGIVFAVAATVANMSGGASTGSRARSIAIVAFPTSVAVAILVTGTLTQTSAMVPASRYVGLAMLAWCIGAGAVSLGFTEWVVRIFGTIGSLSVILQNQVGFPVPYFDHETGGIRYGGLLGHPNFAAYALALVAIILLSRAKLKSADIVVLLLCAAALPLSGSLTALVAGAITAGLLLLRRLKRLMGAACFLGAALYLGIGATFSSRLSFIQENGLGGQNSGTWRLMQWQNTLRLGEDSRLFGIGWQQTGNLLANGLGPHSAYIEAFVELGIVGSVLVTVGLVLTVRNAKRGLGMTVALAYVVATSISDPVIFYPSSLALLMVVMAQPLRASDNSSELVRQ